jgi:outer membrane protein OmpA-like peptidoglycan-associated protein
LTLFRFSVFLLLFPFNQFAFGQEVLWATKVLEKSSESADEQYTPKNRAIQILGKPNVLPQTISSPCSWRPTGSGFGEDYIKVGFEKAIKVRQIIVGETVNPGAIGRIFGYTAAKQEILLYENKDPLPKVAGRTWNILIPETQEAIAAVKILIIHSLNKGQKEYDAIGISNSDAPFVARINLAPNLPKDLQRENLGNNVNSKYGEVAPMVSPDNKLLYYTRLNHPDNIKERSRKSEGIGGVAQDVWVAKFAKDGAWETAQNIGEPINNSSDNAVATISADGKSLYVLNVYLPNGRFVSGLSKATMKNKKWELPTQVKITDFQALEVYDEKLKFAKTVTEYGISADDKTLIMALRRTESHGDKDLYVSFKTGTDTYSKPINLGLNLNSAANEGTPFLAADNKTLYFSSYGHPGYGDADIFMSTRLDDTWTKWSDPINLGPVINSPEWDGYITIPASGEHAYFSSSKGSLGSDDIFKVKLFPSIKPKPVAMFEITFKEKGTKNIILPKMQISQIPVKVDSTVIKEINVNLDEENQIYKTILTVGDLFEVKASIEGYEPFTARIDLQRDLKYKESKQIYELVKTGAKKDELVLEKGKKVVLENLLFEKGKAIIRPESHELLDKIKSLMLENLKMEILLEGHTDNQGDMLLNIKLAEDRVVAVKTYLTLDKKVDGSRITFKSWGPYKPLLTNSSEEAMQKNRRVEITVLKN